MQLLPDASVILPGMSVKSSIKLRITIVGAGNVASALATSLRDAGYKIGQIISRAGASSLRRAKLLARQARTVATTAEQVLITSDVVWFCVPDKSIADAAKSLAAAADWHGKIALHSSGALTSDELATLRRRGAAVASAHPLMTFVRNSRPSLAGVPFAIEGSPKAAHAARAIVLDLGGKPFSIEKRHKEAYHAWGMFASPLFTALLAASECVAEAAGISRKTARNRALPILKQTLANYERLGAPGAFSGPIARGDVATVRKHLSVLQKIPQAKDVYLALARAALLDLPVKNRNRLEKILKR
ncbi:MAG: DUF2520 domain-containing protein [Candidatus Sulfotelmatobacter sp.]